MRARCLWSVCSFVLLWRNEIFDSNEIVLEISDILSVRAEFVRSIVENVVGFLLW